MPRAQAVATFSQRQKRKTETNPDHKPRAYRDTPGRTTLTCDKNRRVSCTGPGEANKLWRIKTDRVEIMVVIDKNITREPGHRPRNDERRKLSSSDGHDEQ